jgi:hypothetical protein
MLEGKIALSIDIELSFAERDSDKSGISLANIK